MSSFVEWSQKDVRCCHNFAFKTACKRGQLDMAQWLYTTFHLTIDDARSCHKYAFRYAYDLGHQNVCRWLVETFGDTVKT